MMNYFREIILDEEEGLASPPTNDMNHSPFTNWQAP